MRKCSKCGVECAESAIFCGECGYKFSPAAAETKEPATERKGSLVGDKNLINNSTIVDRQYSATNQTINTTTNITEIKDDTRTTVVCAVSGRRIFLVESVECPVCKRSVAKEHHVQASKRCEQCDSSAIEEFGAFAKEIIGQGALDMRRKEMLDSEAKRLRIDSETEAAIIKSLQRKPATSGAKLGLAQRAELEAAVQRMTADAFDEEQGAKSLEVFTALYDATAADEAAFWHFLAGAIYEPVEAVENYEKAVVDSYWQRYWGFLAYYNTGSPKGGTAIEQLRATFGDREDDVQLAETVYYLINGFDTFNQSMLNKASERAGAINPEMLSPELGMVYNALRTLVERNLTLDQQYDKDDLFCFLALFGAGKYLNALYAEQVRQEEQAEVEAERKERERLAAERARQKQQEDLAAARSKRMEQEVARLSGKSANEKQAQSKAFAGYETVVPGKGSSKTSKRVIIIAAVVIVVILILFLVPAPDSW